MLAFVVFNESVSKFAFPLDKEHTKLIVINTLLRIIKNSYKQREDKTRKDSWGSRGEERKKGENADKIGKLLFGS